MVPAIQLSGRSPDRLPQERRGSRTAFAVPREDVNRVSPKPELMSLAARTGLRPGTRPEPVDLDGCRGSPGSAQRRFFKSGLDLGITFSMSWTRHQAAIAKAMQQCVYPVEVVQHLELLLQNLLDIRTPERADAVSFSGSRLDSLLELESLVLGQLAGSPASAPI